MGDFLKSILNSQAVLDGIGAYKDISISENDALVQSQLGTHGIYSNGQFVGTNSATDSISPTILLIGGAVLLFVFLKG